MDGFERRRQEKKEAILKTALALFKRYGFGKVSMADIASEASVSQVTIYKFFQSKENLKNELLSRLWDDYFESLSSIVSSNDPIQQKIERLFYTIAGYAQNYTANFMIESITNHMRNEVISTEMQLRSIAEIVTALLEQGQKEGVIRSDISMDAMQNIIEVFRYYMLHNPVAGAEYDKNPELLKEVISVYLNALLIR